MKSQKPNSKTRNNLREHVTPTLNRGMAKDSDEVNAKSENEKKRGGFGRIATGIMPIKSLNR